MEKILNNDELKKEFFSEKNNYFKLTLRLINELKYENFHKKKIINYIFDLWERNPIQLFNFYGIWNDIILTISSNVYNNLYDNNRQQYYIDTPIIQKLSKLNNFIQKSFNKNIIDKTFNSKIKKDLQLYFIEFNKDNKRQLTESFFTAPLIYWQLVLTPDNFPQKNQWARFILNYIFLQKWKQN